MKTWPDWAKIGYISEVSIQKSNRNPKSKKWPRGGNYWLFVFLFIDRFCLSFSVCLSVRLSFCFWPVSVCLCLLARLLVFLFINLSVCLFVYRPFCLSFLLLSHLFVYLVTVSPVFLFSSTSVCPSVYWQSVCLSVYWPVCLFFCLLVFLLIGPPVCLPLSVYFSVFLPVCLSWHNPIYKI